MRWLLCLLKLTGFLYKMRNTSTSDTLKRAASLQVSIIALMYCATRMNTDFCLTSYWTIASAACWPRLRSSNPVLTIKIRSLLLQLIAVSHYHVRHDSMRPQCLIVPCIIFDLDYLISWMVIVVILSLNFRRWTAKNFIKLIQSLQLTLVL